MLNDNGVAEEQEDIEVLVEIYEKYTTEINSSRRWMRPLVLITWCIVWLALLSDWHRGTMPFVLLIIEPPVIWVVRALIITRMNPAQDTPDYVKWWLVLSLVTTRPLAVPVRPLVERHRLELVQRQGCYVRLLHHWRQAAIDSQTIWAL